MRTDLMKRRDLLSGGLVGGASLIALHAVAQEASSETSRDLPTSGRASAANKKSIDESKARAGTGVLEWRIEGPTEVTGQPVCPFFPEYFYQVIVERQEEANIRYLIWNKIAPPGTGAIERVCVNNEGDYAEGKTPTYVDFHTLTVNMSFCSFGDFTLEAILIWQDTGTKANHLQRKSIVIKSIQAEKTKKAE